MELSPSYSFILLLLDLKKKYLKKILLDFMHLDLVHFYSDPATSDHSEPARPDKMGDDEWVQHFHFARATCSVSSGVQSDVWHVMACGVWCVIIGLINIVLSPGIVSWKLGPIFYCFTGTKDRLLFFFFLLKEESN